jgi:hypothetical protein
MVRDLAPNFMGIPYDLSLRGKGQRATPRGMALGHIIPYAHVLRACAKTRGLSPIFLPKKWVLHIGIMIFIDFWSCIWRFLANIGGYWALFEARYWEEVGRWLPNSNLYKSGLLEAMKDI